MPNAFGDEKFVYNLVGKSGGEIPLERPGRNVRLDKGQSVRAKNNNEHIW